MEEQAKPKAPTCVIML